MVYFWIGDMGTCIWFPNIFSHSVSCLFTFSVVSSDEQKFLILMKLNLTGFSFAAHAFGVKKNLRFYHLDKINA